MEQVALSWTVLEMTDSILAVSTLFGLRSIPNLIVSPFAGVLADRIERRFLVASTQMVSIATASTFVLLSLADALELWHIYVLVVAWGAAFSMSNPARHSFVPALVPANDLMNAVALNSLGFNLARALGPAAGGLLLALTGFTSVYLVLVLVYGAVFLSTLAIRTRSQPDPDNRTESPFANFLNGLRYIWRDRVMRGLILLALIPIAIGMPYNTLLPVIARDTLGAGEFEFGLLMAAAGIGALCGGVALATATHFHRGGALLIVIGLLFGISIVVLGVSTVYVVTFLASLLAGGFSMFYFALNSVLVQTNVLERMRGRVSSVMMMEFGVTPMGSFAAGGIAALTSPAATVVGMGILLCGAASIAYIKMRDMHHVGTGKRVDPDHSS